MGNVGSDLWFLQLVIAARQTLERTARQLPSCADFETVQYGVFVFCVVTHCERLCNGLQQQEQGSD